MARALYFFEESPSCPNHVDAARGHRCEDCWLIDFVPPDLRDEQVPCRFVQLTRDGIRLDLLYRYGDPAKPRLCWGAGYRNASTRSKQKCPDANRLQLAE